MNVASLLVPARLLELRRFLRRRVPADLVEDVAQSTACEAWAARHNARGDGFLFGVARHEAYDAMRARRPREAAECSLGDATDADGAYADAVYGDGGAAPATLVTAELVEVLDYVEARPHLHDPLNWLVREHVGDSFEDVAVEEGLSPAAVRQRVSRLRRELRAAFAVVTIVLVVLGAIATQRYCSDHAIAHRPANTERANTEGAGAGADPTNGAATSDAPGLIVLSDTWLTGAWTVESATDPRMLPFIGARVDLAPDRAEISAHGWHKATGFTRHGARADVAISGRTESVTLHAADTGAGTLRIDGAFGSAILTRQR